jgi:hypothetical protein
MPAIMIFVGAASRRERYEKKSRRDAAPTAIASMARSYDIAELANMLKISHQA